MENIVKKHVKFYGKICFPCMRERAIMQTIQNTALKEKVLEEI